MRIRAPFSLFQAGRRNFSEFVTTKETEKGVFETSLVGKQFAWVHPEIKTFDDLLKAIKGKPFVTQTMMLYSYEKLIPHTVEAGQKLNAVIDYHNKTVLVDQATSHKLYCKLLDIQHNTRDRSHDWDSPYVWNFPNPKNDKDNEEIVRHHTRYKQ